MLIVSSFKKKKIIWLSQLLVAAGGIFVATCGVFSFVVGGLLSCCGSDSRSVAAHGLGCPAACGILVP